MVALTVLASERLKVLIKEANQGRIIPQNAGLRLLIADRWLCLEKNSQEGDIIIESNGIKIFVDMENQKCIKDKRVNGILIYWISDKAEERFAFEGGYL